jgi:hypothetical protein
MDLRGVCLIRSMRQHGLSVPADVATARVFHQDPQPGSATSSAASTIGCSLPVCTLVRNFDAMRTFYAIQ